MNPDCMETSALFFILIILTDESQHNAEDGQYLECYRQCLLPLLQVNKRKI